MDEPTDPAAVTQALRAVAQLGGHFTVEVCDDLPDSGGWRTVGSLYADDGSALGALLAETARRLSTDDRRVAGSILHQGFAARLWSIVLGAVARRGVVPQLSEESLLWRSTEASLVELLAVAPRGLTAGHHRPDDVADAVAAAVLQAHAHRLGQAIRATTGLSATVLTGNTASALVGTLRMLDDADVRTRAVAHELLAHGELRGAGTSDLDATPPQFRRASCCLFYRVPGGGLCGDCVLTERPAASR